MCNNYGRELLDLCKASNLRMTNGRFGEDRGIGSFTCFTSRGQSTVDYHILSESLLGRIKNFVVEPPSDISDHCPLITTLYESSYSTHEFVKLRNSSSVLLEDIMLRETPGYIDQPPSPPTKYCWTPESDKEVTAVFMSLDFRQSLTHLTTGIQSNSVDQNISQFTKLLQTKLSECPSLTPKRKRKPNKFPRNAWFDGECKELKRKVKKAGKDLKKTPNTDVIRQQFWALRKQLKTLTRKKKRQATRDIHKKLEDFRTKNPRAFWQYLKKTSDLDKVETIHIPLDRMTDHFRGLNDGPLPSPLVSAIPGHEFNEVTDDEISVEEVKSAINRLKKHKAPGIDALGSPVYKSFTEPLINHLTGLFNQVLRSGAYPNAWAVGVIKPIFKNGIRSDPSNYRGITLLNVMAKLFSAIVNSRLEWWAETNNVLNVTQFGFRKNHRTTDPIFIINSLIQLYKKRKKTLFACFIDFKKAFDSINHSLLWRKLANLGCSTTILTILQNMYRNATSVVCLEGEYSERFPCRRGVRQGCNLSPDPLLFCLFLADLEVSLEGGEMEGVNLVYSKLRLLLFADDLVLLSESTQDLQLAVDLLSEYCATWDLNINLIKTKIIPFTSPRRSMNPVHIFLNGVEIQVTKEYKYLGLLMSANGSLKPAIRTLAAQANKALFSLMRSAAHLKYPSPRILSHLFDTLVRPIAEYACEVWFPSSAEEMEVIHRRFCKFALGLPTSATNIAAYGDIGRVPLSIRYKLTLLKYWVRISTSQNISPLLGEVYELISDDPSNTWLREIQGIF